MQRVSQYGEQRYRGGGLDAVVAPPAWQARLARGLAGAPDQLAVAVEERLQAVRPRHHREALAVAAVAAVAATLMAALVIEEPASLAARWVGWGLAMGLAVQRRLPQYARPPDPRLR